MDILDCSFLCGLRLQSCQSFLSLATFFFWRSLSLAKDRPDEHDDEGDRSREEAEHARTFRDEDLEVVDGVAKRFHVHVLVPLFFRLWVVVRDLDVS